MHMNVKIWMHICGLRASPDFFPPFFLFLVAKTQLNHWTKWVVRTQLNV